jgi:hypothetical protein
MTTSHPVRVGSRVAIYWKLNNLYYPATIIDSNKDCPHTHTYLYDDGSQERFDLRCAKYLVLHGPIPMAAYLAIEAEAGRPTKEDACNDTDVDSSTSVPVGPPPKKKRCVAQSPAIGRPLTRGYQKRFMMMFFIMKPNSRHSHYRMNLPDKPKQWLPEGDEELTEEVLIVFPPQCDYFYTIESTEIHVRPKQTDDGWTNVNFRRREKARARTSR